MHADPSQVCMALRLDHDSYPDLFPVILSGLAILISMMKHTRVSLVCICNDYR